ncbi:ABC transporter substrate-binding protein [Escherichia coli]
MLKSRNETYAENLQSAAIIGEMVGKSERCRHAWNNIKRGWRSGPASFPKGHAWPLAHHANSNSTCILRRHWTGSVLASLGLNVPAAMAGASMPSIGLEQLLAVNPAWLLVAHYREESIVKRWQQDPLWQMLTAAQKQQVASVDSNTWARMRGILLQSVLPLTR